MKAVDYKGKWFVLCDVPDENDWERNDVDTRWILGEGLREHVENCMYYGIPAYIGTDKAVHDRIAAIHKELEAEIVRGEI